MRRGRGTGVDATAFDPETSLAFASNGDGTLTIIHEQSADKFTVVQNVATAKGAKTMALDPKNHEVLLAAVKDGKFEVMVVGK